MYYNNDFIYKLNKPALMASDNDDDLLDNDLDDDLDDDKEEAKTEQNVTPQETTENEPVARSSSGIMSILGIFPITFLILYMIKGNGLSFYSMMFLATYFIGLILSLWTFSYYKKGTQNFTKFDVHSFFKWSEITVISFVLLLVSILNLYNIKSGGIFPLSTNLENNSPAPMYAPKPPESFENEEVLYQAPEVSKPVVKENKPVSDVKQKSNYNKIYDKPIIRKVVKKEIVLDKNQTKTKIDKIEKIQTINNVIHHEDEDGTSVLTGKKINDFVDEAVSISEFTLHEYSKKNVKSIIDNKYSTISSLNVETSPFVSSVFLGGILCASLGYALSLGIAGAILGLFRKFDNPFAAKTRELINEETGQITLETEAQSTFNKIMDIVFRFFIGFNIGATAGFLLGLFITIPLYFLFWDISQNEPIVSSILTAFGIVKNPDLAYSIAISVAGIIVPLVMLIVGKSSPAGIEITEEKVRQVYSVPVIINKPSETSSIPEPAIISFDLDEKEEVSNEGVLVDEFSEESKENIMEDLLSEFGLEVENVFDVKYDLPVKPKDNGKVTEYEKKKISAILENSLGELGNVTVQVSAELGKATIMLTDWLNLSEGMLIELDKPASEEIDILINNVPKGTGKIIVQDNHLAVKVSKSNFSQSMN
ncbi:MAG: FliM/FliN family flagellar motor C-terminal domain-containing protein [Candidatus Woesearchaeota archaeon]